MRGIEDLVRAFDALPAAVAKRWHAEPVVDRRLYLSRGEDGQYAIFIEGDRATFDSTSPRAGVEFSDGVVALPDERTLSAIRITSDDRLHGNRAIAHIAYELQRRLTDTPTVSNGELLASIDWILGLLGSRAHLLSIERQYGLLGECVVLQQLLTIAARTAVPRREVLLRWKGATHAKRDFAAAGIALEVKTTSGATRTHHFGSIEQLDPQDNDESVYVCSIGIRMDTSAPKKLPDYIADIEAGLTTAMGMQDDDAVQMFRASLGTYGYRHEDETYYRTMPGFRPPHLPLAVFAESELDRLRLNSFKGDRLPSMVLSVGYTMELPSGHRSTELVDAVLARLLAARAIE